MKKVVILLLAVAAVCAGAGTFELRGRIEPSQRWATVYIYGTNTPFVEDTTSGRNGRFRFRKLVPDTYVVTVVVPGKGEVRQTVVVSPSFASKKGVVEVTIPFQISPEDELDSIQRSNQVSLRRLSIPERALREYREARNRLSRHDIEGAITRLTRAVEIAPQFMEAWNFLGTIHYQTQKYEEAEKYFRRALEEDQTAYTPLVNLGGVLLNLGRFKEALETNQQALKMQPDDALVQSQLGMSYAHTDQPDLAIVHLTKAKMLDPAHFSNPQLTLADIYLRRSEHKAALKELEHFLVHHPDAPNATKIRTLVKELHERVER